MKFENNAILEPKVQAWPLFKISKSHISQTVWPIWLKFGVVLHLANGNKMLLSKLKISKKSGMRSTLTLGARKIVKVKGQGQGHIRFVYERRIKWTLLHVSILIRTGVMVKRVFSTFLVTLTLTFDLLWPKSIGSEILSVPISLWNI